MTLKTQSNTRVMTIDDGKLRVVVDTASHEVRLFSHYTNEEGKPKLRTEMVLEFDAFLNMLYAMYLQGKTK